jgi:hypothetical protein
VGKKSVAMAMQGREGLFGLKGRKTLGKILHGVACKNETRQGSAA